MTGPNVLSGLYYDWSIPLALAGALQDATRDIQNDPNSSHGLGQRAPREWFSQPRPGSDGTTEVITIGFQRPVLITHVTFEVLRVPCTTTLFYRDRHNNWIPITDEFSTPIQLTMTYSSRPYWYTYQHNIYPVLATALQVRIKRINDPNVGNQPYVVGLRNFLPRRNIYAVGDTVLAIEDHRDRLGNIITAYVRDWDAAKAIDHSTGTFWKSFPQPDPDAVVSLYLDLRAPDGSAQLVDTLYIDPTYSGPTLNVYYSNDPTQGTLVISPVSEPPTEELNVSWTVGIGLIDISAPGTSNCHRRWRSHHGPIVEEAFWVGIEWIPDFDPISPPAQDPILFSTVPDDVAGAAGAGQFWPEVSYHGSAGEIMVKFTNGTINHTYSVALSPVFVKGLPLQIVVGWAYNPKVVFINVTQNNTTVLGHVTVGPAVNLPSLLLLDGEAGHVNFRGRMTALVAKRERWDNGYLSFHANPRVYCNPGSVRPDSKGHYPSTSLDNAVLAVDWTSQESPVGGPDESWYVDKTWTPIFRDYFCEKGKLFLPHKISAMWLKLEFTNLVAEPYPVWDQGITTTYRTFPVAVIDLATNRRRGAERLLTLGTEILTATIGSLNWFNPSTIQLAINTGMGYTTPPIPVASTFTLSPLTTTSQPNILQSSATDTSRLEASNPWIYLRQILNPGYLAGQFITEFGGSGDNAQTMQSAGAPAAAQVADGFQPVTTTSKSNVLPIKGRDWWLFPGGNLKMPAGLMDALTGSEVRCRRGEPKTTRVRFTVSCVHRYDLQTVTLDAAVGYFAGVNEVSAYLTSYIASNDPISFDYTRYDPTTFVYTNITQEDTGPLTTAGSPYVLENPDFLDPLELVPWTLTGNWYWDSQNGPGSENGQGDEPCAATTANGTTQTAISEPITVHPGDHILVEALVAYYGTTSNAGGALSLSGVPYLDGTATGTVQFAMPTMTTTYTVADQATMLALSASIGDSATITTGAHQGTWYLLDAPASNAANWKFTGYGTLVNEPHGHIDGRLFARLIGNYTVPGSGVDALAISLNVNSNVTAGTVRFAGVKITPQSGIEGTVYFNAVTTSTFSDVQVKVADSGLMRSDSMWARLDPLATNIAELKLAPYVNTIPSIVPSGVWADTFATWADENIDWGEPFSEVSINVDPNLIYEGKRAVHFTRGAGAEEAGILVTQQTNMMAKELARICCVFLKPADNTNQIEIRLRRVSDGVYIHTEIFTPEVGYWFTYESAFFELPDTPDQVYTLEFVATGDQADEIFLTNLYTDVAGTRYFLQLGDSGAFLFDITPLAYSDSPHVSCTVPVNEMSLNVGVFNPSSFCYGISLTPRYLK